MNKPIDYLGTDEELTEWLKTKQGGGGTVSLQKYKDGIEKAERNKRDPVFNKYLKDKYGHIPEFKKLFSWIE